MVRAPEPYVLYSIRCHGCSAWRYMTAFLAVLTSTFGNCRFTVVHHLRPRPYNTHWLIFKLSVPKYPIVAMNGDAYSRSKGRYEIIAAPSRLTKLSRFAGPFLSRSSCQALESLRLARC